MGERIIKVCDGCGVDLASGTGASLKMVFVNAARGAMKADLCDRCAGTIPGQPVRLGRGRRKRAVVAPEVEA